MYGKIFSSLFTGSMRGKGDLQLTFAYMISNATADGICDFSPSCISDATGKPLEIINACIRELESPDEMSRTRTDDGRRIRLLDPNRPWGWQIVNHEMYRSIASREAMKEAERLRKREYRESKKQKCPGQVPDVGGTAGAGVGAVSGFASDPKGDARGGRPGAIPEDGWSIEQVLEAAKHPTVAVPSVMAGEYFDQRTAKAWVDATGQKVAQDLAGLMADLRKWKRKDGERAQSLSGKKRIGVTAILGEAPAEAY